MLKIYKITSHNTVDYAAEELKKYLRMMMPRGGEITIQYSPSAKDGFRLGVMSDFGIDTSEASDLALDDVLHIDTTANGGIISGSNPRSVLLAVYKYLNLNGCRWLFPGVDGEDIPIKNIEPVSYHKMADCRYRGQASEGAINQARMLEAIEFTPKLGMNVFMMEFDIPYSYYTRYYEHTGNEARDPEPITEQTILQWKRQCEAEIAKRGLQYHDMGHGWTSMPFGIDMRAGWINNDKPFVPEESREFLPLINGERQITLRSGLNTNFCMSRPEARRKVVKSVADYAEISSNVDYLHVWLADGENNHCECDECKKKIPSDWYVILLNEIDEELTRRCLKTRIVMICYVDSTWAPVVESLKNPDRFSLLVAAISRDYSTSVDPDIDTSKIELKEYSRNNNVLPASVGEYIAYSKKWLERCCVPAFAFEYHFWWPQFRDLGIFDFANTVREDVIGYKAHGIDGIVENGSQRSFFPNGLCFHTYAATLFDTSVTLDSVTEDLFLHAYGDDWRVVREFFREIGDAVDQKYMFGKRPAEGGLSVYYNPSIIPLLQRVREITEKYRPFIEAHKNMPKRAQTVSYRVLARYLDYLVGLTDAVIIKAGGKNNAALDRALEFLHDFGKYEIEMEASFDQCISFRSIERLFKDVKDPIN